MIFKRVVKDGTETETKQLSAYCHEMGIEMEEYK